MSYTLDRHGRLAFLSIDQSTRTALSDFRPIVLSQIDGIVSDYFAYLQRFPDAARSLQGASIDELRRLQKSLWVDFVFNGDFGDEYFAHAIRTGETYARLNVEPRWFIAGYNYVLNRLVAIVAKTYPKKPDKLTDTVTAIDKAVFLDLEVGIFVQLDAQGDKATQTLSHHAASFEKEVSSVVDVVANAARQLQASAETLASGADQATRQSEAVAQAAQQASGNVDTVAAATEELHASIKEISRQVEQSAKIASEAVAEAGRADGIVQGLANAAQRIGEVVKLINDIASQTNLLALNATIEAARAGDAGKGFAVVAGEVKNLANQTARATDDISAQVQGVQEATKQAVSAIQSIGTTIGRMSEIASTIASAVEEQGSATRDIARNVQEAARGTQDVSAHISGVTHATETASKTARDVLTGAGDLNRQADHLSKRVETFLTNIRRA